MLVHSRLGYSIVSFRGTYKHNLETVWRVHSKVIITVIIFSNILSSKYHSIYKTVCLQSTEMF